MKKYAAEHDWFTVFQLPSYTPELNPVESVWSLLWRGPTANTASEAPDHVTRTRRRGLRHVQLQHQLVDGCLARTRTGPQPDHLSNAHEAHPARRPTPATPPARPANPTHPKLQALSAAQPTSRPKGAARGIA